MRKRPGKRERVAAKRNAFQAERARIVAANLASPLPERPTFGAPRGLRNSVLARDNLKSASHDIGFVGPRGYHTPRDTVSKREQAPGLMAGYTTAAERKRARELSDMVKGFDRETQRG